MPSSSGSNVGSSASLMPTGDRVEVTPAEMAAILEGIDLSHARRQRRYVLPATTPA